MKDLILLKVVSSKKTYRKNLRIYVKIEILEQGKLVI